MLAAGCGERPSQISRAATVIVSLAATPTTLAIRVGDSEQLAAAATLSDGSSRDVTGGVQWSTSDGLVVTADVNGVVTAVGAGDATVTATDVHGTAATSTISLTGAALA